MNDISVKRPADSREMINGLLERMRRGVVTFAYKKESTEEVRIARGTLDGTLFDYEFKTGGHRPRPGLVTYWDMDRQGWRSLKEENILQIQ